MSSLDLFSHRHVPATQDGRPALLLLHGTGGNEDDLLPIGAMIAPGSALLSPRGRILESGMPRFFRRLREGVFDEADVRLRAGELAGFVAQAREAYGLPIPLAVGFSNGANIAAAMLQLHPESLAGAVLWRAMAPLQQPPVVDLASKRILILSGGADSIVPPANVARLAASLRDAGAQVRHETLPAGHGLTQADGDIAREWLAGWPQPS